MALWKCVNILTTGVCVMKLTYIILLCAGVMFFRDSFAAPLDENASYKGFTQNFDGLLKTHLHPSQSSGIHYMGVDYTAWGKDPRHAVAKKILLSPAAQTMQNPNERKAFWINAYNFLTIDLIISKGEKESIKNLGTLLKSPWKSYTWPIAGQDVTLDKIEHEILRPLGDPRIHMAINCASISCPDLRPEAYLAESLDARLNEQVSSALTNTSKILRYEAATNTLYLSSIFKWFSEDFKPDAITWLGTILNNLPSHPSVHYMPYDWGLNKVNKN